MNNVIFFKKLPNVDCNLIHLYEHLVMNGFQEYLFRKGLDPNLVGNYNGETFTDLLYIYGEFNDKNYAKLFNNYMDSYLNITKSNIKNELQRMGAENCAIYHVADGDALRNALCTLHNKPFVSLSSYGVIEHRWAKKMALLQKPIIQPYSGVGSYDIVSINIELSLNNLELAAVFSSLAYYLNESICCYFKKYGAYYCGDVIEDNQSDNAIVNCIDLYMPKGEYDADIIRNDLSNLISSTDFAKHAQEIDSYFSRPYKPSGMTYDYQSIGLFISQTKLKDLLTVENANKVWRSLRIDQINIFPDERQCNDVYLRSDKYAR